MRKLFLAIFLIVPLPLLLVIQDSDKRDALFAVHNLRLALEELYLNPLNERAAKIFVKESRLHARVIRQELEPVTLVVSGEHRRETEAAFAILRVEAEDFALETLSINSQTDYEWTLLRKPFVRALYYGYLTGGIEHYGLTRSRSSQIQEQLNQSYLIDRLLRGGKGRLFFGSGILNIFEEPDTSYRILTPYGELQIPSPVHGIKWQAMQYVRKLYDALHQSA